jgi:hypothetical protein
MAQWVSYYLNHRMRADYKRAPRILSMRAYSNLLFLVISKRKKGKIVRVFLGRIGFLLWRQFGSSLCRCILRLLQVVLSFLLVLFPLPFCRGASHVLDEVELLTKHNT